MEVEIADVLPDLVGDGKAIIPEGAATCLSRLVSSLAAIDYLSNKIHLALLF